MRPNRSMPRTTVIPVLIYPDVQAAVEWLCAAFGFSLRWQVGKHRAQLNVGDGAVVVASGSPTSNSADLSVMVRVEDVPAHHAHAAKHGAKILEEPTDFPYGERQYSVEDLGGHRWTFSQTIADVDPRDWGATVGDLN